MVRSPLFRAPGAVLAIVLIGGAALVVGCGDVTLVPEPRDASNGSEAEMSVPARQNPPPTTGGAGAPACAAGAGCCETGTDCKMDEARGCPCSVTCENDDKKGKCQLLTGGGPGPD